MNSKKELYSRRVTHYAYVTHLEHITGVPPLFVWCVCVHLNGSVGCQISLMERNAKSFSD